MYRSTMEYGYSAHNNFGNVTSYLYTNVYH